MLLIACGLTSEAKIAKGRDPTVEIAAGGGDAAGLSRALEEAAPRAAGILSFGIAGGLEPSLRPGDVRVAGSIVVADGERFGTDPAWASALATRLGCPSPTVFACADQVASTPAQKAALRHHTGADLVDMESAVAARVAAAHGLPFAALRVVTDAAHRSLPPAVAVSMKPGGDLDLPAILRSVAREPGQIPGLLRTARDSRQAFAALLRCRQVLGPGFALLDLA